MEFEQLSRLILMTMRLIQSLSTGHPTIGKTHQVTNVAANLDIPIAILTHRYETHDNHLALADQFDDYVAEIPTFDRTCPTKRIEHSNWWAERLTEYRSRGASPTYLHYYFQDGHPRSAQ